MAYPSKPVCCRPWCSGTPSPDSRFCPEHEALIEAVRAAEEYDALGRRLSSSQRPTNY